MTRFLFSSCILFGALLGSGAFLLHQQVLGWFGVVVAGVGLVMLRRTGRAVTLV